MERLGNTTEYMGRPFLAWLELIEGSNREAVELFLASEVNLHALTMGPGSREAHQAWKGGWMEHERQAMAIAMTLYDLMQRAGTLDGLPEQERFTCSDMLTVLFLHDIEKPFVYGIAEDGSIVKVQEMSKPERKAFRQAVIDEYGFVITDTMANALKYVEGVRDEDYVPGARADQPLAALCHAADNMSARAMYNHGRPQ